MSRYVTEIVNDVRANPDSWEYEHDLDGIHKDGISLYGHGNTKLMSISKILAKDHDSFDYSHPTMSYMDCYRVESALLWWFKNCNLDQIKNKQLNEGV